MASSGQKKTRGRRPRVPLERHVHLWDDLRGMIGVVAALILQASPRALVIWHDGMWTSSRARCSPWCRMPVVACRTRRAEAGCPLPYQVQHLMLGDAG
jgi:hypothetical protein